MTTKLDKLDQRILDQNKIDTALLIKNDRMGRNARPRVNVVKKNLTGIDEELLKEYQQVKPQTYEYIDEAGETKYRKYQLPQAVPDLEEVKPEITEKQVEDEVSRLDNRFQQITGITKAREREIDLFSKRLVDINDKLNKSSTQEQRESFFKQKRETEITLIRLKKEVDLLIQDLRNIDALKNKVKEDAFQYNTEQKQKKQANLERINMYRDELNFLNKGAFSTEKAVNESEAEYLERLQRNAEIQAPEDQLTDAKTLTVSRFREKMRELIKDPVLIEQVINTLDQNSDENVDDKANLLKNWNLLKTKFISTYGVNNKRLTASDIITFFDFFLETGESGLSKAIEGQVNLKETQLGINTSGVDVVSQPNDDTLMIVSHTAGGDKYIYFKSVNDGSKLHLLYSFTGDVGSFKEFFDEKLPTYRKRDTGRSSSEIEKYSGITPAKLNSLFDITIKKVNPEMIAKKMFDKYGIRSVDAITDAMVRRKKYALTKTGKASETEYGMGIPSEDVPQYVSFGDVILLLQKLYYHNQLSVKNKQMKSVAGFRTTKVSEPFVKLIMNMVKGMQPTHSDVMSLSSSERQIYDRLVQVAHLNKSVAHNGDKTISELKHRLKMIEGQIEIGNNNPMLRKELYSVLHSLKNFKVITQTQINNYLKQFS